MSKGIPTALIAVALFFAAPAVHAFESYVGSRPLGMGGGSRALATGDSALLLNPSGMSLVKAYTLDGGYAHGRRLSENYLHASVVDNTSEFNIAGGVYYTYHMADPSGAPSGRGHEGGAALSLPFGDVLAIGATVKYLRLLDADVGPGNRNGGVTFDVGATIRPVSTLALGVVGTNVHDLDNGLAPIGVGYGAALLPIPALVVEVDGRTTFERDNLTGRKGTSILGGAEWTLAQKVSLRAGGGYDAASGNGYLSAGLSALSEIGAFDIGVRQDVSQHQDPGGVDAPRQTMIGVNLRLFVPANQTPPNP